MKNESLQAITHVDNSARLQSMNAQQCSRTYDLLTAFKKTTGVGVLCNTSLNFIGKGFINQLSDLLKYQQEHGLDAVVYGENLLTPRR